MGAEDRGRANHHFDVLVGVYAIADVKGFRLLPPRDVFEARMSQRQGGAGGTKSAGGGAGVRTPDGRAFFATQRQARSAAANDFSTLSRSHRRP